MENKNLDNQQEINENVINETADTADGDKVFAEENDVCVEEISDDEAAAGDESFEGKDYAEESADQEHTEESNENVDEPEQSYTEESDENVDEPEQSYPEESKADALEEPVLDESEDFPILGDTDDDESYAESEPEPIPESDKSEKFVEPLGGMKIKRNDREERETKVTKEKPEKEKKEKPEKVKKEKPEKVKKEKPEKVKKEKHEKVKKNKKNKSLTKPKKAEVEPEDDDDDYRDLSFFETPLWKKLWNFICLLLLFGVILIPVGLLAYIIFIFFS